MSLHIGFQSDSYSFDKFSSLENKLIINNYYDSNVICINTAPETTEKSFINYKNRFLQGITSNTYIIHNLALNSNILEIRKDVKCNTDLLVKDLFATSSNLTIFTSNIVHYMPHSQNRFTIYNNNQSIFEITPNFTSVNNMKISNTLYTDKITNNLGETVQIVNPTLIGLSLQSFNTEESIIVKNLQSKYYTTPTLLINRFDNYKNIIEINSCNIRNTDLKRHFTMTREGLLGIGSQPPDAPLSISLSMPRNPYIFKYNDLMHVNTTGHIGIGTTACKGMLHISRNDSVIPKESSPLIKLDMSYNSNLNVSYTSNAFDVINKNNFKYYVDIKKDSYIQNDRYNYNVYQDVYLLNDIAINNVSNLTYSSNAFNLTTNNQDIVNRNKPNNDFIKIYNKFFYPASIYAYEQASDFSYTQNNRIDVQFHTSSTSNTSNFISAHYFNHGIVLMTKDTYDNAGYVIDMSNPRINKDKFTIINGFYSNVDDLRVSEYDILNNHTSNFIVNAYYNIKMYIEDTDLDFPYQFPITPITYMPPYFLHISSNNAFKASLSASGTLSLGSLDSNDKYLLHADGSCFLQNVEINKITTDKPFLDFNSISLSNISKLYAASNFINNSYLQYANISNAYIHIQECSNLYASNMVFENMRSSYCSLQASNIHITTTLSIAKDSSNMELNPNTLVLATVHSNLTARNTYYKHFNGMRITNHSNIENRTLYERLNPSITVLGFNGSIPYVNLGRISTSYTTDYFMRINNRSFSYKGVNESTDILELCCDNMNIANTSRVQYYKDIDTQASFINHFKNYNLLTFGELNNICVQCANNYSLQPTLTSVASTSFTNGTNKIAIGFPFGLTGIDKMNIQHWPQYFNNEICNMNVDSSVNKYAPYMLNVFGNVSIASIYGKSMLTARVDSGAVRSQNDESVTITVGTLGDVGNTMTVHANTYIKGTFGYDSDSNIKTDLVIIENALEKINCISGYTFSNLQTRRQDTGLIAQEVQHILPEAVLRHKDSDMLGLAYGNMMSLVVESIKALDRKITMLNERLDAMNPSNYSN